MQKRDCEWWDETLDRTPWSPNCISEVSMAGKSFDKQNHGSCQSSRSSRHAGKLSQQVRRWCRNLGRSRRPLDFEEPQTGKKLVDTRASGISGGKVCKSDYPRVSIGSWKLPAYHWQSLQRRCTFGCCWPVLLQPEVEGAKRPGPSLYGQHYFFRYR